jgi:transposase
MKITAVGVDIAKNVFQAPHVDEETGEIVSKPIKRAKFLAYFANRAPCLIGMEARGGAHHWARQIMVLIHQVRLMSARFVKAFNVRNKNDAADARAILVGSAATGQGSGGEERDAAGDAVAASDAGAVGEVSDDADQWSARVTG